jgi:hypothetical protein
VVYADDVQIFASTSISMYQETLRKLEECLKKVSSWLAASRLILNPQKSEFIILSSKSNTKKISNPSIVLNDMTIAAKEKVRSLGVIIDRELTFDQHITQVRKTAFLYLRLMSKVRKVLDNHSMALLVQSLVYSRINYCCSLFVNFTKDKLRRLQSVLNYGIRLVEKQGRTESTSSMAIKRGWMSVTDRAKYRLAVIAYSAMKRGSPKGLRNLLKKPECASSRSLRSQSMQMLFIPRTHSTFGDKAFSVAAPNILNSLPREITSADTIPTFCIKLKKHIIGDIM